jgi:putative protease
MTRQAKQKPELLLPAGNTESFHAALEAGADAVYLGAKHFNARERAGNFSPAQLKRLVQIAHEHKTRVYLTLNTLIRNDETDELLDVLHQLEQIKPDALIIQDWGVYHLVKRFFPSLSLHASTQMANHNSIGSKHAKHCGIERVIMARELTREELRSIVEQKGAETEIFMHGALCYSFSGMCLFSSYLGGMSANRGQCKQPCRRIYHGKNEGFLFSLKDNQLIDLIPEFSRMGISSLKIEGRMKPAEYVFRVGKAYRMALDDHNRIPEAKALLESDMGREKTGYFTGGDVSTALANAPVTGKYLGKVISSDESGFRFECREEFPENSRIRVFTPAKSEHATFKIKQFSFKDNICMVKHSPQQAQVGDEVYLSDIPGKNFSSRLSGDLPGIQMQIPKHKKQKIQAKLKKKEKKQKVQKPRISIRIDQLSWLPKTDLRTIEYLFVSLSKKEWEKFDFSAALIQKFKHKIVPELPKFIPESQLDYYKDLCEKAYKSGLHFIGINHLSQRLLCHPNSKLIACENLYSLNDLSIQELKNQHVQSWIRPQENDFTNLIKGFDRDGIVPVYFHPHLFMSRMPVKTGERFSERSGETFLHYKKDGLTFIIPEHPVSLSQYRQTLSQEGFYRFLIDLSFTKPSSNRANTIQKRVMKSVQIQPSSNFNFKMGLT